jgi:hypothetical protein
MDFEDDFECATRHGPPFNPNTQVATAEAVIAISCLTRVTMTWTGSVEQVDPGKDTMELSVAGTIVDSNQSDGNLPGQDCAADMESVGNASPPQYIDLNPGLHVLRIKTDTGDELYHFGAFYEMTLTFQPL